MKGRQSTNISNSSQFHRIISHNCEWYSNKNLIKNDMTDDFVKLSALNWLICQWLNFVLSNYFWFVCHVQNNIYQPKHPINEEREHGRPPNIDWELVISCRRKNFWWNLPLFSCCWYIECFGEYVPTMSMNPSHELCQKSPDRPQKACKCLWGDKNILSEITISSMRNDQRKQFFLKNNPRGITSII